MSYVQQQCRRGMLELDFIFQQFLNQEYDALTENQKRLFSLLLQEEDPTLYDWLVTGVPCTDGALQDIVNTVRLK
ncbi:MAG: succinate dehydrogenase assembly factor 2 [Gammaproteobacteria bacterium]|nr:succinate dehydrogenase assembly factor 2 [Gammaproteobacteria bacterium]